MSQAPELVRAEWEPITVEAITVANEIVGTEPESAATEIVRTHDVTTRYADIALTSFNDPLIPDDVEAAAIEQGLKHNILPELLMSFAETESRYDTQAVSKDGQNWGAWQINITAQADRMKAHGYTAEDMLDADKCAEIAAEYLEWLFERYEDIGIVVMAYNGDKTGLKKYRESGELSNYATKVIERSLELERQHHIVGEVELCKQGEKRGEKNEELLRVCLRCV